MVREDYAGLSGTPLGAACCPGKAPDHGTAALAGYGGGELDALSRKVAVFSHGCGNPSALAGISESETILDLGSGAGLDLLLAAEKAGPGGNVIGVDMTEGMVSRAREAAAAWGAGNVEVREGIMEKLPVKTGTVDRVISNCAVNLSPEKSRVFAETARVLKPGGTVTISDIVVRDLPDWAKENRSLYSSCVAGALEEEEYLEELAKAGLAEVRVLQRAVFDELQLGTFLRVGATGSGLTDPCSCSGYLAGRLLGRTAEKLSGKVGRAYFAAVKPGQHSRNASSRGGSEAPCRAQGRLQKPSSSR
jgi:ubiquinone/menaquinone biosynthesis C-methylase UbiE